MSRFCPSCGTEIEQEARFCPTCGHALEEGGGEREERPAASKVRPPAAHPDSPTAPSPRASAQAGTDGAPRGKPASPEPSGPQIEIPVSWPVTLSGWLIGVGSALAALGLLIGFFGPPSNPIDAILLLAFMAVVAVVFFATVVPEIPHLPVAISALAFMGFGVGVDRIGFGAAGWGELLLFLGAGAASIGAIVAATGQDQPLGGPRT